MITLPFFIWFAEMSSSYDLYKGTAHCKRKAKLSGEILQQAPKQSRVEEPSVARESPSTLPEVEVLETPPWVASPPVQIFEEPRVDVTTIPSPVDEPVVESTSKEARQELFNKVS